jgi:hypothetical protein
MREITPELALRMRRDRGLMLPVDDVHYTNDEVASIAKRWAEIFKEMEQLDKRLLEIAKANP